MSTKPGKPRPIAQGAPPWDSAPTPSLGVFTDALKRDPELLYRIKGGHLINLLPMALDALEAERVERGRWEAAANSLALKVAELEQVAEADARRKATKRAYQADYRKGIRGGAAARAAQRSGVTA